ncbi:aminoglycoside phosphotransferase family protein [Nocardia miyunensis]|uniref:aminoglycoside phosphotransferase family protein n=1 Tax=Nocardia miyunensis TaxID=282684 RepID=UPI0008367CD2|nr:aminoglycoside phosphotransferase family protein [Nocardia miyunensis]
MADSADGRAGITADLVAALIAAQFPQWRHLSVTPVASDGWDNRTYRLGEAKTVRLPTAADYAPAVSKESRWLPRLAPMLPASVPTIVGVGVPDLGYRFPWSVRRWIPGESADHARIDNPTEFAVSVAEFIRALQACDTAGAPMAGAHSFYRGGSLSHYDRETRDRLNSLTDRIDVTLATAVWNTAVAGRWNRSPVWFHGDIAPGNLLIDNGKLTAVIDFGTCGVGDPACDLVLAWTKLSGRSREAFRRTVRHDTGTWARARGWALWKALLTLTEHDTSAPGTETRTRRLIDEILAEHRDFGSRAEQPAAAHSRPTTATRLD